MLVIVEPVFMGSDREFKFVRVFLLHTVFRLLNMMANEVCTL